MNRLTTACAAALSATTLFAAPSITGVTMSQDANSRLVTISYTLEGTAPAVVNVSVLSNGVDIGRSALEGTKGTVSGLVQPGKNTITWKPTKSWPGHVFQNKEISAQVKAWSFNATPDYMILDLENPSDIRYYEKTEDFPVPLGDDCYRKRYIVMRKIPAAGIQWRMGSPKAELSGSWYSQWYSAGGVLHSVFENTRYVTLTKDFYLGVYELTDYQYKYVNSGDTTGGVTPSCSASYDTFRGTGKWWPNDGHDIDSASWLYKLRAKFDNLYSFDLPTEAQWEFACRAGTSTARYDGSNLNPNGDGNTTDSNLDKIAWYGKNAGDGSNNKMRPVGGCYEGETAKLPNGYGLYDIIGNALEYCLDQWVSTTPYDPSDVIDPKGSTTRADTSVVRGGWIWGQQQACRSADRAARAHNSGGSGYGFRLCVTLP